MDSVWHWPTLRWGVEGRLIGLRGRGSRLLVASIFIHGRRAGVGLQVCNMLYCIVIHRICAVVWWSVRRPSHCRRYVSAAVHSTVIEVRIVESTTSINKVVVVVWTIAVSTCNTVRAT